MKEILINFKLVFNLREMTFLQTNVNFGFILFKTELFSNFHCKGIEESDIANENKFRLLGTENLFTNVISRYIPK